MEWNGGWIPETEDGFHMFGGWNPYEMSSWNNNSIGV
jgi:hypothetical protein